ncbi:MAG TPA: zinc-binding alcohol dehydrogenase [Sphingobium sp.]|nr:zinc-binding alcohol dehydrogenase [Sphingobium sp.]
MSETVSARAVWFESERRAALREESVRAPGPEEIRVRALHSLVSAGSEMNLYRGQGNLPSLQLPTCEGTLPFPIKFGYQVVGEVEEAGAQSGFQPGDRVFCAHPHQERFTITTLHGLVRRLPRDFDPLRAALLNMCTVAFQTLLEAPVRIGEVAVVSGLGTIGSFAGNLARRTASRLILVDPIKMRRDAASWIGADAVIGPDEVAETVAALSDGRGADTYIETSGAPPALQTAIVNTGARGTVAVPAWYGTRPVTLSLSPEFHLNALNIKSVFVQSMGGDEAARWDFERRANTVIEILRGIEPTNFITHRVPFSNASEAYRILDEKADEALGVVLDY